MTYFIKKGANEISSKFKNIFPLSMLDIEITERCNNNCIHCYINRSADDADCKSRELSSLDIKNILREAYSLGCRKVRITGGEPILRRDFEKIYLTAREIGLRVILFTNATLITEQLAKMFASISPMEKIEISVYGMSRESYEAVTRNPGSFASFNRGVGFLLENKVPFVVKGSVLPPNRHELVQFDLWASKIPWMDSPPASCMMFDLRCRRDSTKRNGLIRRLRLSPGDALRLITRNKQIYLENTVRICTRFLSPPSKVLFSCGAGMGSGCVDSYGRFLPCIMLKHPETSYDLKKGSLSDAMNTFVRKVRGIKAEDPDYLQTCARCFLRGLCSQCPARSWTEHGTLDRRVKYQCAFAHAQARYLGLISEHERAYEVGDYSQKINDLSEKLKQSGQPFTMNEDTLKIKENQNEKGY